MDRRKKTSKFKFKFKLKENFLFILFGVINLSDFVGSSVSDIHALQCFAKVSSFHHHVSYGHMGLEIRFSDFRRDLNDVNKRLVSYNSSGQGLYVKSTLARLQAVVSPSVSRQEEYENLFCAQPFRVRRQAGVGIMAAALSAAALYDVEALRGTVDEMKTRQNELVRQLVSVSNASALNF